VVASARWQDGGESRISVDTLHDELSLKQYVAFPSMRLTVTCRLCQRHVYLPYRALYKLYPIMLRDMALHATEQVKGMDG
jgi:hypothetical protein